MTANELTNYVENPNKVIVVQISTPKFIPVMVWAQTRQGHYEYIESSKLKFYRNALGLMV